MKKGFYYIEINKQGKSSISKAARLLDRWEYLMRGLQKYARNLICFCIFLQSPHKVDMKNIFKGCKDFFVYFNTLETHREQPATAYYWLCKEIFSCPPHFSDFQERKAISFLVRAKIIYPKYCRNLKWFWTLEGFFHTF